MLKLISLSFRLSFLKAAGETTYRLPRSA